MEGETVVRHVKELWNTWDIRVLILVSLLVQALLTFVAPLRKRSASGLLKLILWLLYLSASAIALYIISQISGSQDKSPETVDLLSFWAPFLLLHLGGPDTITALALEDNELWHRHALELATQVSVTVYVFSHSVYRRRSHFWFPAVLMFVDGCIKYLERTQALYYASIDSFRDSLETDPEPGPNYARLMEYFHSSTTANIPSEIQGRDDPTSETVRSTRTSATTIASCPDANENNDFARVDSNNIVVDAYRFFNKFKGLIADNFVSLKDCKECRDLFLAMKASEATRIIEIELNLMYDVFYTKAFLLETKQAFLRVISFLSVITSLLLFSILDKSNFHKADVLITYMLLAGAIALDVSAGFMFLSSDWYVIINNSDRIRGKRWAARISTVLLKLSQKWRSPGRNRWCRSISQYNLLKRCFKDPPSIFRYIVLRGIRDGLIGLLYVKSATSRIEEETILKFIVNELKRKADFVEDYDLKVINEVCTARGNLVLEDDYCLLSDYLQPWTTDIDYDESLLTWHLATDFCYYTRSSENTVIPDNVQISKKLSDYMSYLIIRQQTLVSTVVGMSDKRFADTCAEARKFLMNKRLNSWYTDIRMKTTSFMFRMTCRDSSQIDEPQTLEVNFMRELCEQVLNVNVDVRPIVAKGDKSKSVLFEACRLAKQLKLLGEELQWEITSKVWLELMCYAAVRCTSRSHVAQLNKGGELITLVWLLMAHLGFGDRFLRDQGFGWTKLIIQK